MGWVGLGLGGWGSLGWGAHFLLLRRRRDCKLITTGMALLFLTQFERHQFIGSLETTEGDVGQTMSIRQYQAI